MLLFIVTLTTSIITARALGPSGKGLLSIILLAPTLLLNLGSLGISSANIYYSSQNKFNLNEIISNSFLVAFTVGSLLVTLFFTFFNQFQNFFQNVPTNLVFLAILSVPIGLLLPFLFNILLPAGKIKEYNFVKLSQPITFLLGFIVLSIIFKKGLTGAVISYFAAIIVATIFSLFFLNKIIHIKLKCNFSLLKKFFGFGLQSHLGSIFNYSNRRLDMYIINLLIGVENVGFYAIAVAVSEILWYIPTSISALLFSKVSANLKDKKSDDFTALVCRNTLFILFISAILLAILAKPIIKLLYSAEFLPSLAALMILLPGIVFSGIISILNANIKGNGRPIIPTLSAMLGLITNIPLNFLLIPKYGIRGAALATTISYTIVSISVLIIFSRLSGIGVFKTLFPQKSDFALYSEFGNQIYKYVSKFSIKRVK